MRESIGGAWLFGVVIVFIALFSAFLAYSISYTRAFNVKNEIINYIERNEGYELFSDAGTDANGISCTDLDNCKVEDLQKSSNVEANIFAMIKRAGYNYPVVVDGIDCAAFQHKQHTPQHGGYCITKYCKSNSETDQQYYVYYRVTTFIAIKLPIVNITMSVPISGETKSIYFDQNKYKCEAIQETGETIEP